MKQLLTTILTLAIVACCSITFAQEPPEHHEEMDEQEEMMQHPMMRMMHQMHRQMMENPMHRSMMMAHMLPALKDTLDLSEGQIEELEEIRSELRERRDDHMSQMMEERQRLMQLFEDEDHPDTTQVREHFEALARHQAEHQAGMYEQSVRMRAVLTPEQRDVLDEMSSEEHMHYMMRNMTMMDMMEMMQARPGGMMMRMGPGMMHDETRHDERQQQRRMQNE